jgi:type II secretory pathway pseudopilin PulG
MPTGKSAQSGFTYLFVLMLVALIGMGLAMAGTLWHTESQRERETELLFIGDQYRQAIRSYYELDPAQPRLPQSIDDLLEDDRRPDIVRHLRRAWRDPLTGGELALIRDPGTRGIVGVYSPAPGHPFKTAGFPAADEAFTGAKSYQGWRFVVVLSHTSAAPTAQQNPARTNPVPAPRAGGRH